MAGIPVHTSAPINSNSPTRTYANVNTTTTAEPVPVPGLPASVPANTTARTYNSSQTAQPGAPPVPAPTSIAASTYTPSSPTKTTPSQPTAVSDGPPPPQPGQVPTPFAITTDTRRPSIPPPPKAGTAPTPSTQSVPPIETNFVNHAPPMPAGPKYVSPVRTQPPAGVTSVDLSHPPGYRQDHRASFADRPADEFDNRSRHTPSPTRRGRGILDEAPVHGDPGEENPLWGTAVSWAKAAGEKLSQSEAQIWKAIQGEK